MKYYYIIIDGVPPLEDANQFWREIECYKVNFMVLDKQSYIYGETDKQTIEVLNKMAQRFGFDTKVLERGY